MELSPQLVTTVVTLLTFIVVVILLLRHGSPMSAATLSEAIDTTQTYAGDLSEIALQGVQSAEQLARTGKITRDDRFEHAFAHVRKFYPDLDEESLVNAIESAVLVTKAIIADLPPALDILQGKPGSTIVPGLPEAPAVPRRSPSLGGPL